MRACTAQARDGAFCDAPSMPDAPFPICERHATAVYRHVHAGLTSRIDVAMTAAAARARERGPRPDRPSLVYYVRELDGCIKIGVTQDLDARMSQLRLDVSAVMATCLLYTSPSPRDVEESRMPSSA